MKLTWVNHASYILEGYGVKMISDPWIDGRVFNKSWALLAPSKFTAEDYKDITHIWFSHEHPDHFFPPNISKIPVAYRQEITVFFQETMDKRVIQYCQKMGFKEVVEVSAGQPYNINEYLTALIVKVKNDTDSWMYLKTPEGNLLNLNDCLLDENDEQVLLQNIDEVDVLLTQFSFANWVGNPDQTDLMRAAAEEKKTEMARYVQLVKPKKVIPFASFVWFCAPENYHFNAYTNKIDDIYNHLLKLDVEPMVFYPGDEWDFKSTVDSSRAIAQYKEHVEQLNPDNCTVFESVQLSDLIKVARNFASKALSVNNRLKLLMYKPFTVYLYDLSTVCSFSYKSGLKLTDTRCINKVDVKMHSQSLKVCFENDYGFDTILIAGTFEKPEKGNFNRFMEYEWVANLNNQGKRMKGILGRIMDRLIKN